MKAIETPKHGVLFVGSMHSERLKLARLIKAHAKAQGVPVRIYIRVGLFNFVRQLMKGDLKDIHFRALPYEKYLAWTNEAEAVLDLPHPLQTGLTMRTFEAIGLGKKIITTNRDVVNYPFFDPKNVCVVSENDPVIPAGFLNGTSAVYDPEVVRDFSLRQWLHDVLGLDGLSDIRNTEATRP